jgi:hypothetical protein
MLLSFVDVVLADGHMLANDLHDVRVAVGYKRRSKKRV